MNEAGQVTEPVVSRALEAGPQCPGGEKATATATADPDDEPQGSWTISDASSIWCPLRRSYFPIVGVERGPANFGPPLSVIVSATR